MYSFICGGKYPQLTKLLNGSDSIKQTSNMYRRTKVLTH